MKLFSIANRWKPPWRLSIHFGRRSDVFRYGFAHLRHVVEIIFMPAMRGRDEMSHWPFFGQRHIFDTKFPV
jgi:hypothetical protein